MVEENFEIRLSETSQNGSILLLFFHSHTMTMVEESFEIRLSETLQNGLILLCSVVVIPSPWLKKILKFDFLKRPRMT